MSESEQNELTPEMVRLIIAARIVAFGDPTREEIRELGQASEAFADQVPWDDEPDDFLADDKEGGGL